LNPRVKAFPVIPREGAHQDIEETIGHYLEDGAGEAALGFIDALERAFTQIGRHPESGSTRFAHELNLPGLRSWPLKRFPYLACYVVRDAHVDVWRILHARRDVPNWLQDE
jgi:toxin ParE1/3/4